MQHRAFFVRTGPPEPDADEALAEGLEFLAGWIDQISSRLRVTLADVNVRVEAARARGAPERVAGERAVRLHLPRGRDDVVYRIALPPP